MNGWRTYELDALHYRVHQWFRYNLYSNISMETMEEEMKLEEI
jgi:hypothetical protein